MIEAETVVVLKKTHYETLVKVGKRKESFRLLYFVQKTGKTSYITEWKRLYYENYRYLEGISRARMLKFDLCFFVVRQDC